MVFYNPTTIVLVFLLLHLWPLPHWLERPAGCPRHCLLVWTSYLNKILYRIMLFIFNLQWDFQFRIHVFLIICSINVPAPPFDQIILMTFQVRLFVITNKEFYKHCTFKEGFLPFILSFWNILAPKYVISYIITYIKCFAFIDQPVLWIPWLFFRPGSQFHHSLVLSGFVMSL